MQALKEIKSEETRVSGIIQKTASSIFASVKKDLIAEVLYKLCHLFIYTA
jgi:hypothetical protein